MTHREIFEFRDRTKGRSWSRWVAHCEWKGLLGNRLSSAHKSVWFNYAWTGRGCSDGIGPTVGKLVDELTCSVKKQLPPIPPPAANPSAAPAPAQTEPPEPAPRASQPPEPSLSIKKEIQPPIEAATSSATHSAAAAQAATTSQPLPATNSETTSSTSPQPLAATKFENTLPTSPQPESTLTANDLERSVGVAADRQEVFRKIALHAEALQKHHGYDSGYVQDITFADAILRSFEKQASIGLILHTTGAPTRVMLEEYMDFAKCVCPEVEVSKTCNCHHFCGSRSPKPVTVITFGVRGFQNQ